MLCQKMFAKKCFHGRKRRNPEHLPTRLYKSVFAVLCPVSKKSFKVSALGLVICWSKASPFIAHYTVYSLLWNWFPNKFFHLLSCVCIFSTYTFFFKIFHRNKKVLYYNSYFKIWHCIICTVCKANVQSVQCHKTQIIAIFKRLFCIIWGWKQDAYLLVLSH